MDSTRHFIKYTTMMLLLLSIAACGHDPGERALSGGAIGAGVGVGAAVLGAPTVAAVAVGGVGGAAIGALTSDKQVDLDASK